MTTILILAVIPALIVYAAVSDLLTMTIANRLCLALFAAFPVTALAVGLDAASIGWHLAAGFLVLVLGFCMFAAGWIGGGDAKFAAAAATWIGFAAMPDFLFVASLGGGVLTLLMLWMKNNPLPSLAVRWPWYARLQDKESGVPYGIALSLGALMAWPQTQIWAAAFAP